VNALVLSCDWAPRAGYPVTDAETTARKARVASSVWRRPRFQREVVLDPTPGPHEVVVRVRRCGVCGSDTHCLETDAEDYILFSGPARFPCSLGHEYAGVVVAVGSEVRDLRPGMLVCGEGMLYCGTCEACRRGLPNQCPRLEMTGFSAPGAYADALAVHERHLWSLDALADALGSADAALDHGALVEPIACAYNGMFIAGGGFRPGAYVVVYGCGPIGLGAILLARLAGAALVVAFDVVPERVEVARRCGADVAHDLRGVPSPSELVRDLTRGWGADVQVEAAGAARATMPEIERAFAPGGLMVYLGRTGGHAPVELDRLVSSGARIAGSRGHAGGGCYPALLRLMERARLDATAMITHRAPLADALPALQRSTLRTDGKILLSS
jgi:scyllo-inosose 3-dehydrogenase